MSSRTFNFDDDSIIPIIISLNPSIIFSLTTTIFLIHYFLFVVKKPKLICRNVQFKKFLLTNCPILLERYWPTFWCYQSHLMTFLSHFFRGLKKSDINYNREIISTPDGGQISLDWYHNYNDYSNQPIALFLPGLTGCSQAEYIKPMVRIASKIGYRSVVLNHRGVGNTELLTPRLYCGANDDDLRTGLDHIRQKNPNVKLISIGVSLGGIILTRYLITSGSKSKIDFAFLISVCWDFIPTNANMERWINLPLNNYLTRSMISIVDKNSKLFEKVPEIDLEKVRNSRYLCEFDEAFTRRIFNFKSVKEFYTECSYKNRLKNIKTFTLCINSVDDMFSPGPTLPCDVIQQHSDHLAMVITSYGGHIGFMEGVWPTSQHENISYYLERLAEQYFQAIYNCDSIDY